jgi:hypothetical protein
MKDLQIDSFIETLIEKANEGIKLVKKSKIDSQEYNTLMNNTMNTIQVVLNKQQFYPQQQQFNEAQPKGTLKSLDDLIGEDYLPLGKTQ